MKLKLIFVIVLSLVFVVSACGSAGNVPQTENLNVDPPPASTEMPSQPEQPTMAVATESQVAATEEFLATEEIPLPAPTSRGPELEATDPSTVALASSNLQLVEFFRFT